MNFKLDRWLAAAALTAAAVLPTASFAQATWDLGASTCGSGGTTFAQINCTGSGTTETATMMAFGTSGPGTALTQGTLANWDPSGFGAIISPDSVSNTPQHAFDSSSPASSTEMMLIGFGPYKVNLTSVALGWYQTDADVSILRWDGAYMSTSAMAAAVAGKTTDGLLASGWTLVGSEQLTTANYNNLNTSAATSYAAANTGSANDASKSTISLGTSSSSYWMISTYFGTTTGNLTSGNDAFKILNFAGTVTSTCADPTKTGANCATNVTTNPVPEPGSLALVGLALAGVYAARRRQQKAA